MSPDRSGVDVTQGVLIQEPLYDDSQMSQRFALFDEATGAPYPFVGEPWRTMPADQLTNGWHYFNDELVPQYRKRPNGMTDLRGFIAPGEQGPFFVLPENYRHKYPGAIYFPVAGESCVGLVAIWPDGTVSGFPLDRVPAWYDLSNVRFSND